MKLSKKTDYALRVLLTLADQTGCGPLSINQLAQSNDVPKRFLEHIMLELKEQGWVSSSPGRKGGYILTLDPADITVGQVVRQFERPQALLDGATIRHDLCTNSPRCRLLSVYRHLRDLTSRYLDHLTLAHVTQLEPSEV